MTAARFSPAALAYYRQQSGYSAAELGAALGDTHRSTIQRWEHGLSLPDANKIAELADELGVDQKDFYEVDDDPAETRRRPRPTPTYRPTQARPVLLPTARRKPT